MSVIPLIFKISRGEDNSESKICGPLDQDSRKWDAEVLLRFVLVSRTKLIKGEMDYSPTKFKPVNLFTEA